MIPKIGGGCLISMKQADDKYKTIRCYQDGYVESAGSTLINYYNTPEKVEELLSLGDIISLGQTIDSTVACNRDRDEPLIERVFDSFADLFDYYEVGIPVYLYVFDHGTWFMSLFHDVMIREVSFWMEMSD